MVVSPLLAMRDQVDAATRLGLVEVTINSSTDDAWSEIEDRIDRDDVDLLPTCSRSPREPRLPPPLFDTLRARAFAPVGDEAHCIPDRGHDFRPDDRRLRQLVHDLPAWAPVLATTATANQRVTDDVATRLERRAAGRAEGPLTARC